MFDMIYEYAGRQRVRFRFLLKFLTVHLKDEASVLLENQFRTYQEIDKVLQAP